MSNDESTKMDTDASSNNAVDAQYFDSYFDIAVHELMLKDKPRNNAYKKALENANLEGKVVLDVGCGTGLLSLFAARCGAKKVYAVEASEMADYAAGIVRHNEYDEVIEVIHEKMEDVTLPEKVDVIVSEWMGFYLLHESMLPSVLYARDRWLKEGGLMLPSEAELFISPISLNQYFNDHFHFWENVEGFDMTALLPMALKVAQSQLQISTINKEQLLGSSPATSVVKMNLHTIQTSDLELISGDFSTVIPEHFSEETRMHAFCCWFDVSFWSSGNNSENALVLSTAPGEPTTHWQQSVILLPQIYTVKPGLTVEFRFMLQMQEENKRRYHVTLEVRDDDVDADDEDMAEYDRAMLNMVMGAMGGGDIEDE